MFGIIVDRQDRGKRSPVFRSTIHSKQMSCPTLLIIRKSRECPDRESYPIRYQKEVNDDAVIGNGNSVDKFGTQRIRKTVFGSHNNSGDAAPLSDEIGWMLN